MISLRPLSLAACTLLASASIASPAQEPAFLLRTQAARYTEGPDFYHYIYLCKPAAPSNPSPAAPPEPERSLCWAIRAMRLRMVDGKLQPSEAAEGILAISRSQAVFVPDDPKKSGAFTLKLPSGTLQYKYNPQNKNAVMGANDLAFVFVLKNICAHCASGTMPPPLTSEKAAQLDREFEEIGESLKHFDAVADRIAAIAASVRVALTPENQPPSNERPTMMALFAQLNQSIARVCPESARLCVESYANFQHCKSATGVKDCGSPPTCSAFFPSTWSQIQKDLKANACTSRFNDSAALFPDWTPLFAEDDVRRKPTSPA